MIVLALLPEDNCLQCNLGHGIFQKVTEEVMGSHGILTGYKCTNPVKFFFSCNHVIKRVIFLFINHMVA